MMEDLECVKGRRARRQGDSTVDSHRIFVREVDTAQFQRTLEELLFSNNEKPSGPNANIRSPSDPSKIEDPSFHGLVDVLTIITDQKPNIPKQHQQKTTTP
jgi:hypothetical protein